MEKTPEVHFQKPEGKKQTATVVVGALAIGLLAVQFVFKPLFNKFVSKDKSDPPKDSGDATASV